MRERFALARRRGRAPREPPGRPAPARGPRARDAARAARCSSSTSRPPASTSQSRGLFWELIQERGRRGRHGLRHHPLPRRGRTTATASSFIDAGRLIANATPEALRAALLRRLPHRAAPRPAERERRSRALRRGGLRGRGAGGRRSRAAPRDARRRRARGACATCSATAAPTRCASSRPSMNDVFRRAHPRAAAGAAPAESRHEPRAACARSCVREVRATLRDPFTLTVLIAVPLVALLAFSSVLSTKVEGMSSASTTRAARRASRRLVADLARGRHVRAASRTRRARRSRRALVRGELSARRWSSRRISSATARAARPGRRAARGAGALRRRRDRARRQRRGLPEGDRGGDGRAARGARPRARGPTASARRAARAGIAVVSRALFNPTPRRHAVHGRRHLRLRALVPHHADHRGRRS